MTATQNTTPTTQAHNAQHSAMTKKHAAAQAVKGLADFLSQLTGAQQGTDTADTGTAKTAADADTGANAQDADNADADNSNEIAKILNGIEPGAQSADTSNLDPAVLSQLQDKLAALTQDGQPLSSGALAQFKADALKMLKDMGVSADDAQKYMLALTQHLGSNITNAQAAYLVAPLQLPNNNDSASQDAQNALDSAKAAQDMAGKSLQQASGIAPDTKAGIGGPADDASNKGLPPQQQPAAPAVQHDAPPAPKAAADAHGSNGHNATASAGGSGGNTDTGSGTSDGGGGNGGLSSGSGSALAGAADGAKASISSGGQSFSNILTQTQNAPQIPQMVALQIQRNLAANVNTFTMRLDPAELGSLEIRMSFGKDGSVKTHLIADKPETLSMLKNDSQSLNRLLQQSGLNADEGSLSFDLRQQNQQQGNDGGYDAGGGKNRGAASAGTADNAIQAKIAVETAGYVSQSGVNIMV